jgi:SAM-dependent methyltransferase
MRKVVTVPRTAFKVAPDLPPIVPTKGRFYPQGLLRGLPGIYPQNIQPFRIINAGEDTLTVDLNHPLADVEARLEITPLAVWSKQAEFGGQCQDWICALTDGPGLKRKADRGTDFGLDVPLEKPLGEGDAAFYATPRKVAHVDSRARENIANLYARLLSGRKKVLDLMSGWQSHLPDGVTAAGLGMNAEEMSENPALSSQVVHDLNVDPALPFADRAFDAVICSLSVEYLTRPLEVFREIARVLEPGGLCVMVFSHRWFPDQAVKIWTEMHEFERAGLVTEYFRQSGGFKDLTTLSERGWPRPMDARDRYYPLIQHSDPVHAVWGIVS